MLNSRNNKFQIIRLSPQDDSNEPLSQKSIEAFTRLGEILANIKREMIESGNFDLSCKEPTVYDQYDTTSKNQKRRVP